MAGSSPSSTPKSVPGMPSGDFEALMWMQNFAATLGENPEKYGSTRWEADHIAGLVNEFEQAQWAAQSPSTKTTITVAAKNQARSKAALAIRAYLNGAGDHISDIDRLSFGLPRKGSERKRGEARTRGRIRRASMIAEVNAEFPAGGTITPRGGSAGHG